MSVGFRQLFQSFILVFATFGELAEAAKPVYRYKPKQVSIVGKLEIETFPVPPSYESIKDGDEIEKQWCLRLNSPIDIDTTPADDVVNSDPEPEKDVRVVQLAVMNDRDWSKRGIGKNVRIRWFDRRSNNTTG